MFSFIDIAVSCSCTKINDNEWTPIFIYTGNGIYNTVCTHFSWIIIFDQEEREGAAEPRRPRHLRRGREGARDVLLDENAPVGEVRSGSHGRDRPEDASSGRRLLPASRSASAGPGAGRTPRRARPSGAAPSARPPPGRSSGRGFPAGRRRRRRGRASSRARGAPGSGRGRRTPRRLRPTLPPRRETGTAMHDPRVGERRDPERVADVDRAAQRASKRAVQLRPPARRRSARAG